MILFVIIIRLIYLYVLFEGSFNVEYRIFNLDVDLFLLDVDLFMMLCYIIF